MISISDVIGDILILAMASAAISITLTRASVFEAPRGYVAARSTFFGTLFSCTYCMSHWVSLLLSATFFSGTFVIIITIAFIMVFVVKVYTSVIDYITTITQHSEKSHAGRTRKPAAKG